MSWMLGLWAALVITLYAFAPGHHATLDELAGYFLPRHGAFDAAVLIESWSSRAQALAAWCAINAALAGAGSASARLLDVRPGLITEWLLGLAPVSLGILGLGLAGLVTGPVLAGCLLGFALFIRPRRLGWTPPPADAWLAAAPCLIALPAALAPEIVFDALRYHLVLPDLYLKVHRVVLVDRFLFSCYPQGMEMLYAPALALGTTVTAKLLTWQTFAGAAILLHGFLASRVTRGQALAISCGFSAMPFLSVHAATAGVDLPVIALELAGFMLLSRVADGATPRRGAALAGWLFGAALGIKYLAVLAIGAAALALAAANPRAWRRTVRHAWIFIVTLPAAWGVKNWLLTGNPAYPYLFGHWQLEPETFRLHLQWARDWNAVHPWWSAWAAMIPVSLTRGVYDALSEALSPVMFLMIGLAAAASRPLDRRTRFLVALSAILWLAWNQAAGGIYRYAAPLFPAVFLATGELLPHVRSVSRRAMTSMLVLGAVAQLPPLLAAHYRAANAAGVILGWESERMYLLGILPPGGRYLPAVTRAAELARGGRVLMLGDPKTFYAPGRWVAEFEFAPSLLFRLAEDAGDADRMRIGLRQRGIGAVLYRVEGMISVGRMSGATLQGDALVRYQAFWSRWMEPAWTDEHPAENAWYQAYRVRRAPGPFAPPVSALRYSPPGLETLTTGLDLDLDAHHADEALAAARELTHRMPAYAPGWLRLREAATMTGRDAEAARAASMLRRSGFDRLLRHPAPVSTQR